jgi:hypothetical protein
MLKRDQSNYFMGFRANPFSKYSAEEELDFIEEIFHKPNYYSTLLADLKSGASRFILGHRGNGKSSLINYLKNDLERDRMFTIIVDKFDGVPIKNNEKEMLDLVIRGVVKKLGIVLLKDRSILKRLTKIEKEKLMIYVSLFFDTISKSEFDDVYDKIGRVKSKNIVKRVLNIFFIRNVNVMTGAALNVSGQLVAGMLGAQNIEALPYKEYFPELKDVNPKKQSIKDSPLYQYETLKSILVELIEIICKLQFKGTVILFDKIDEFKVLMQDINKIVEFTKDILTDTELLLHRNISIGFSLWTEIRYLLNAQGVRFDKFKEIDVTWSKEDLNRIITKRLRYFTRDSSYSLDRLISNELLRDEVLELAHKSPRDLIRLLSCIYDVQLSRNMNQPQFADSNIQKGMVNFAKNYDYISVNPTAYSSNGEIMKYISKLLLNRQLEFDLKTINNTLHLKPAKTSQLLKNMLACGIIIENEIGKVGDIPMYRVVDPKIRFLIRRNEVTLDIN